MTEGRKEELKRRIEELERRLNEYKNRLDELPQVVFEIDIEGVFSYVNKTGMNIFGYDFADFEVGINLRDIFVEEDLERVKKNIEHQLRNEEKEVHEYTCKEKQGKRIPVLVYSSVIKSKKDAIGIRGVAVDISKRKELERKLREQSIRDSLTGLYNYGYLKEVSKKEANRAKRHNYKIGLLIADINFLKEINDMYGHQKGDEVIKQLASILNKTTRKEDDVFRYGGDEFLILIPQTHEDKVNCASGLN
ncbi:MAG: GGDEF domain-containing protein, partial [Candidatus Cloacimonetes bacterium]|nr:GGDEF domain-containing protein [Candidatus Cloacimonadota bacterium]